MWSEGHPKLSALGDTAAAADVILSMCREGVDDLPQHGIAGIPERLLIHLVHIAKLHPVIWVITSHYLVAEEKQVAFPAMGKQRKMFVGSGLGGKFIKCHNLWKFWFQKYIERLCLPNPHENESMLLLAVEQYPRVCSHHVPSSAGETGWMMVSTYSITAWALKAGEQISIFSRKTYIHICLCLLFTKKLICSIKWCKWDNASFISVVVCKKNKFNMKFKPLMMSSVIIKQTAICICFPQVPMFYIGYSFNSFVKILDFLSVNILIILAGIAWFSISFASAETSLHLSYIFPPGN